MHTEQTTQPPSWALDRFLTLSPAGPGWEADIPMAWSPTGPAHGGILFGLAVTAMRSRSPHPDLLTATAHFLRRIMPGPAQVTAQVIRAGRAHATLEATLTQNGKEIVRVLAVFGTLPGEEPETELEPPALPPPGECVILGGPRPDGKPGPLDYASTLDVRIDPAIGWAQGITADNAEMTGWCRMADDRPHDAASLVLLADGFPPPILNVLPDTYVPTLELTVHIRGVPSSSWLRGRFTTRGQPPLSGGGRTAVGRERQARRHVPPARDHRVVRCRRKPPPAGGPLGG